jgi:hypothetical protein
MIFYPLKRNTYVINDCDDSNNNNNNNNIGMRRLTTGIFSEKCVVRQFRRCAKVRVNLHKPR